MFLNIPKISRIFSCSRNRDSKLVLELYAFYESAENFPTHQTGLCYE